MIYVLAPNNVVEKYPYTLTDMLLDNPNVSFPTPVTDSVAACFNTFPVKETPQPEYDPITQNLNWIDPINLNEVWVQQWNVTSATPEEIAMREQQSIEANKQQAESLLQATDWTENASVRNTEKTPHLVNGEAFDDYRVALRAIAVNPPVTVAEWPVKPDEQWSTQ